MNWNRVHGVWALIFRPRKQSLGVQTLCIIFLMMLPAPAIANSDADALPPLEDSARCTTETGKQILESVQRKASETVTTRYLLSVILRSLDEIKKRQDGALQPGIPSVQEGR